jgi:AmiR/NasT family two-component response regulator
VRKPPVQAAVRALGKTALIGKPFDEAELAALLANAVKKQQRDASLPF